MSSPSFSYAESVLSHLEKVQRLPVEAQADIARRVDNYIKLAKAAKGEALLARLASSAGEEQAKAIGQGASLMDPRWAAPAIAEAWCYATISLSKGYLDQLHAEAIIRAIEAFTANHVSCGAQASPSQSAHAPRH
jgi:hypothetical protein